MRKQSLLINSLHEETFLLKRILKQWPNTILRKDVYNKRYKCWTQTLLFSSIKHGKKHKLFKNSKKQELPKVTSLPNFVMVICSHKSLSHLIRKCSTDHSPPFGRISSSPPPAARKYLLVWRYVRDNRDRERGRFDEHHPLMVSTTSKEKPSDRDVSFSVYRTKSRSLEGIYSQAYASLTINLADLRPIITTFFTFFC